jgi:hypothetical protein
MKQKLKRAAAVVLAAVLTLGPAASASQALGTELHVSRTQLAQGVEYTSQSLWSATYSDLRTENYVEYTPNSLVQPAVAYGSKVLSTQTLTSLAQSLESQGKRVLTGVNGDYFVMATGAPLGLVVTDGVLRSSSSYLYALGFDGDGRAFIGQPSLSITAAFRGNTLTVGNGVNKVRSATEGYVLYTSDFAATTEHTDPGVDVILTPVTAASDAAGDSAQQTDIPAAPAEGESGQGTQTVQAAAVSSGAVLTIGGTLSCTVEQVLQSTGSIAIPEGKLVLSINNKSNEWLVGELAALQPGDRVDLSVTAADSRWNSAVTAIGGLYKMVTGGVVEAGLDTTETAQAPRTAVGIKADGSAIFYTIDGRQSGYSVGASMKQVAQRLVELGCVEAMCLDGGGSTSFGASLPGASFGLLNSPSDGSQRAVTNALFLVAQQAAPGAAQWLALTPGDALVLPGTRLTMSAKGVDAIGQTVASYSGESLTFDTGGAGTVQDGVLTVGSQAGFFTVTASADGLTGSAAVTVVTTPDQITVRDQSTGSTLTSVSLQSGTSIDLTASAVYRKLQVTCSDESFTWSVTGGLGTIDQNGVLTAGEASGSGTVTVSAGGRSVTLPLTVSGHVVTVEDFEGDFAQMTNSLTANIDQETRAAYVRFGSQSAQLSYDLTGGESAAVGASLKLQTGERYLSLWVYGDGSGNTLSASFLQTDGSSAEQTLAALSFTGWQQVTVPLPQGVQQLLTLRLLPTGTAPSGTIWLDQVTSSNQPGADATPPTVSLSLGESTLTATVRDNVDQSFAAGQITVTCDGQSVDFTLSGNTVTAALPVRDLSAHRVTVTATDASGNIGRASADLAPLDTSLDPFDDTAGHWAADYANYLYAQGISNGVATGGGLSYQPDKDITRGEFALMCARWLRLDLGAYQGVQLPFADVDSIPAWCLDGVKAMYALGILQGSAQMDGSYAYAQRSITRAEAMTMLGRMLPKGYAGAELTFADTASIPAWAAEYVQVLVAQGVVNGTADNTLAPNASIKRGEMAKILYAMR